MNTLLRKNTITEPNPDEIKRVSEKFGLLPKLAELLFSRGIKTDEQITRFLHADKSNLYDPFLMKNMREVVERVKQAISSGEKIIVYGDYDVDGICASAILSLFFSSCGADVVVHIPNRETDGYGLNVNSIESLIEEHFPDLILTCDCGISGVKEVEHCQDLGVDIIVTDHHEPGTILPSCPIINPKQPGDEYPDKFLCGAGVALKLVQALCGDEQFLEYADIAAVATIADLVPLLDENRLIVQLGLKRLTSGNCNVGLKRLLHSQNITGAVTSADIAYRIAPRLNAAGRMGDAYRAFEIIVSDEFKIIDENIKEIEEANSLRKKLCDEIYGEAEIDLAFEDISENRAIILTNPSWSKGVTGIAAARFASEYNRPTFIIVDRTDEGVYKGTARGIKGINIYEALTYCADLLVEFGGHPGAAGFSIQEEKIPAFRVRVNEYFSKLDASCFVPTVGYDLDITTNECNSQLLSALSYIEPTGNSNARPLFRITADSVKVAPCKNPMHSSVKIGNLQTYAFNFQSRNQFLMGNSPKDIVVELSDGLNGGVSGYVKAVSATQLYINDNYAFANYLSALALPDMPAPVFTEYEEEELPSLLPKSIYGTLFICADRQSYEKLPEKSFVIHDYMYRSEKNNYSGIIVSPFIDHNFNVANYTRIVFADTPPSENVIAYLNSKTKARIFVPKNGRRLFDGISAERDVFGKYYSVIKSYPEAANSNLIVYFKKLSQLVGGIEAKQFVVCYSVFKQLGFIDIKNNRLIVNGGVQKPLSDSAIYRSLLS